MVTALGTAFVAVLGGGAFATARAGAQVVDDSSAVDRPATLPDGSRRVRGRVVIPHDSASTAVPHAWVTIHRVASDGAGPMDSVRTGPDGRYAFTYRPHGAANAIYFVSVQYDGIAYFSPPLRDAVVTGDNAEITVFDTTSARVPITVRGRHVVVSRAGPDGSREVLNVFELSNDGDRTAVPTTTSAAGVWSAALPLGATSFAVRATGDVPGDGMTATNGRAVLRSPLAPGIKQIAYSYRLPAARFPFTVRVEVPTVVLEVLVEDASGTARGAGLVQTAAVSLEGHTFHRYLAQDVPAGAQVTVDVPALPGDAWPRWAVPALIAVVGGAMTAGLLVGYRRHAAGRASEGVSRVPIAPIGEARLAADGAGRAADVLLAQLAALDDAHSARSAAGVEVSAADEASYANARADLKRQLAEQLDTAAGAV